MRDFLKKNKGYMITKLKDIKVLVTGISGFIGSHLVRGLLEEGAEVHGLVRGNSDLWRIQDIKGQINLCYADLRDFESVKKVISKVKPKKIIHLAAYVDVSRSFDVIDEMIAVNIIGTLNLLKAANETDYDCFINTGSCEEYGNGLAPFREDQIPNPVSPYSASKVSTTLFCRMLYETMDLPIITVRPFLTYGPMQESNMLIPALIKKAINHEEFKMTKGEQTREFNYVDDIVDGIVKASVTKKAIGEIINIGNGNEYKVKDVVARILNIMGDPIKPLKGALPYREGETMHFYCDNTKAKEILNWTPRVSLDEGLEKTTNWYTLKFLEQK